MTGQRGVEEHVVGLDTGSYWSQFVVRIVWKEGAWMWSQADGHREGLQTRRGPQKNGNETLRCGSLLLILSCEGILGGRLPPTWIVVFLLLRIMARSSSWPCGAQHVPCTL